MGGNHGLSLVDFRENMGLLGLEKTREISDRIFAVMDVDGKHSVNLHNFLSYMDVLMHGSFDEKAEQSFKLITKGPLEPINFDDFSEWLVSIWVMYHSVTG